MSERERLERDLRRQAGELASSQERAHLARELHDSVTQALFSMTLVTRTTELLVDRDVAAAKEKLGSLRDLQREALAEMRALIFELRPGNIEQDGLLAALKTHAAGLQGRIGLPIVVTSDLRSACRSRSRRSSTGSARRRFTTSSSTPRPARSRSRSTGRRAASGSGSRDDGKGFEAAARARRSPRASPGCGPGPRRSVRSFEVTSRPGAGTTIEVTVPDAAIAAAAAAIRRSPIADGLSSAE